MMMELLFWRTIPGLNKRKISIMLSNHIFPGLNLKNIKLGINDSTLFSALNVHLPVCQGGGSSGAAGLYFLVCLVLDLGVVVVW